MLLEKSRATRATVKTYSQTFATGNPNAIFVQSDIVPPNRHWIVLAAQVLVHQTPGFTAGPANPFNSNSGLFLCPQGTKAPVNENLNGVGANLLQTAVRPIEIDDINQGINIVIGTDQYTTYVLTPQATIFIPSQWFLMGIANAASTNGFAGIISLTMEIVEELDCA